MGTARQAIATTPTSGGINGVPPVTGSPDQVVSLLAVFNEVMTKGQIAQSEETWNWDLIGAWQASTALTAEIVAQALPSALLQLMQYIGFLLLEGPICFS